MFPCPIEILENYWHFTKTSYFPISQDIPLFKNKGHSWMQIKGIAVLVREACKIMHIAVVQAFSIHQRAFFHLSTKKKEN